jgi:hypothetical protein
MSIVSSAKNNDLEAGNLNPTLTVFIANSFE